MSTEVTLRGRLTRDPELAYSAAGKPVARFSVVTSRRVKDGQTGEWRDDRVTFWDVVAFGQLAENIVESLVKGVAVLVTGNAYQEEWTDKEGQKRRTLKVTAEEVAPSLRWAQAKISKVERSRPSEARTSSSQAAEADPWANDADGYSDTPPF